MTRPSASAGWHDWLISDSPASRRQARLGQFYRQWLAFRRNPLAVAGLVIVVALLLVAAFAPLLATHDPLTQTLDQRLRRPRPSTGSAPMRSAATSTAASSGARGSPW
jgi:peptide/nickel transport system permease protein